MRQYLALVGFLLVAACATGAAPNAPQKPEGKLALAREIAAFGITPEMLEVRGRAYADEYRNRMPDADDFCENASDVDGCETSYRRMMVEVDAALATFVTRQGALAPRMIELETPLIAKFYTAEELVALKKFYDSPVGRAFARKAPIVAEAFAASQYALLRPLEDQLQADVTARSAPFAAEFAKAFGQ